MDRAFSFTSKKLSFPKLNNISPTLHLVAGVSEENGLEGYAIFERSVDSNKFLLAIQTFLRHGDNLTLLGDNASWHRSRQTFAGLRQMGMFFIKNVPYSPVLNPIENVFSLIKNDFKRRRLQALQLGTEISS
jgi:hypothetical protein